MSAASMDAVDLTQINLAPQPAPPINDGDAGDGYQRNLGLDMKPYSTSNELRLIRFLQINDPLMIPWSALTVRHFTIIMCFSSARKISER